MNHSMARQRILPQEHNSSGHRSAGLGTRPASWARSRPVILWSHIKPPRQPLQEAIKNNEHYPDPLTDLNPAASLAAGVNAL